MHFIPRRFGFLLVSTLVLLPAHLRSQQEHRPVRDAALQRLLQKETKDFHGVAGVYVYNLKTGRSAGINADTLFPTASMIKVSILCALFDRIERGEFKYDQQMLYRDSLKIDNGIAGSFRDSTKITLAEIVMLMISVSDNTAARWCQQLAGTGTAINDWLERNGFHQTRVNSHTPGRETEYAQYGWGQTTPKEMVRLFTLIRMGRAVSPDASEEMYRVLSKPFWDDKAVAQIPPNIHVSSKNGSVDDAKSETVFVNAPSGDYVFCVATKNQADQRWVQENEGYVLIRSISRALWKHFEPRSTWTPPAGYQKWTK